MLNIFKRRASLDELLSEIHAKKPEFTPDINILQKRYYNWLFVPDECMLLGQKHHLVQNSASGFYPFYEDCYTSEKFTCLEKHLDKESQALTFKVINDGELPMWMNQAHRVKGELYSLTGEQIIDIDNYKKNTVYCDRVRVNINVPYTHKNRQVSQTYNGLWSATYSSSKPHLTSIEAWMYISRMDYWRDQLAKLDNFRPVKVMDDPDRVYVRHYYDYKFQSNLY